MSELFEPHVEVLQVISGPYDNELGQVWNVCLIRDFYSKDTYEEEYFYSDMQQAMDDVSSLKKTGSFLIDALGNTKQDHHDNKARKVLEDV